MKTVSVVMATYNGDRFILEQLQSLAAQTLLPNELVVRDDCSTDRTVEIVKRFAENAPFPVRLCVNDQRMGWAANFMAAAQLSSHDLIAFCDQDDVWHPEKIGMLLPKFDVNTLLACHEADVVDANLTYIRPFRRFPQYRTSFAPLEIGPWDGAFGFTQMFCRELLRFSTYWPQSLDHDRAPAPMAHDQWFFFWASVLGSVAYIPVSLAKYRQHGKNAVGSEYRRYSVFSPTRARLNVMSIVNKMGSSEARERILRSVLQQSDGQFFARVSEAIQKYTLLSQRLRSRVTLYSSPEIARRIESFLSLVLTKAYSIDDDRWRFGINSLLKDVTLGTSVGHLLSYQTNQQQKLSPVATADGKANGRRIWRQ